MSTFQAESLSIVGPAVDRLRRGVAPMAVALAIAEVVAAVAVAPVGAASVNWLIRRSGNYAVANDDLVRFALSPVGIAAIFVSLTVGLAVTGLGRSAALLASHCAISGRRVSGVLAFAKAVVLLPRIFRLAARQVGILALLAAPFALVVGLVVFFVLRGVDLYWMVTIRPARFWVGVLLVIPPGVWCFWVVGRRVLMWSVSLPLCVLCGRRPTDALRESESLLAGRLRVVAAVRLSWLGIAAVIGGVSVGVVQTSAEFLLHRELGGLTLTAVVAGIVLLAYLGVAFLISLVATLGDISLVHSAWSRYASPEFAAVQDVDIEGAGRVAGRVRLRLLGVLGVAAVLAGVAANRLLEAARVPITIEITAHRGAARLAPENTLAAIRAAIGMGADRVEVDVMRTADGQLVLFHDTDLRRIARDPRRISGMTLAELREIDAGSWFGEEFAGEPIPTLEEAVEELRGRVLLNAELKTVGDEEELASLVAAEFRRLGYGVDDGLIVTSLSTRVLSAMRVAEPDARIGLIVTASMGNLRRVDADFLVVESGIATGRFLRRSQNAGIPVHVWGVSSPDQFARLALQGVEGVIASDPQAMIERRDELDALTESERLLLAFRVRVLGL